MGRVEMGTVYIRDAFGQEHLTDKELARRNLHEALLDSKLLILSQLGLFLSLGSRSHLSIAILGLEV